MAFQRSMRTLPAGEFKQRCLALLDEVGETGEPILVTKRGRPVAQLVAVSPERGGDWKGALRSRGKIHGDLVAPAAEPDDWAAMRT